MRGFLGMVAPWGDYSMDSLELSLSPDPFISISVSDTASEASYLVVVEVILAAIFVGHRHRHPAVGTIVI